MQDFRNNYLLIMLMVLIASIIFTYYKIKYWSTLKENKMRIEADKVLKESEDNFRVLFNSLNDGLCIIPLTDDSSPGNFKLVNNYFLEMLGYSIEEIMRISPIDIEPPKYHKEFPDRVANILQGKNIPFETELKTKDGKYIPVEVNARLYLYNGGQSFLSVVRNITQRKKIEDKLRQSEERYRNIFENANIGIFQTDAKGQFITVNPAVARMLGYDSPEEVINSITDISNQIYVNPHQREEILKLLADSHNYIYDEAETKKKMVQYILSRAVFKQSVIPMVTSNLFKDL